MCHRFPVSRVSRFPEIIGKYACVTDFPLFVVGAFWVGWIVVNSADKILGLRLQERDFHDPLLHIPCPWRCRLSRCMGRSFHGVRSIAAARALSGGLRSGPPGVRCFRDPWTQRHKTQLLQIFKSINNLGVHQKALSNRWVTRMPGVLTESGEMTPTGTIVCGSAMTTSAASAITGLKLCAVSEYSRLP